MVKCCVCNKKLKITELKNIDLEKSGLLCSQCVKKNRRQEAERAIKIEKREAERARKFKDKEELHKKKILLENSKWEYHVELFTLKMGGAPREIMIDKFAELGGIGWELVDVSPIAMPVLGTAVPITKGLIAVFKRKKVR